MAAKAMPQQYKAFLKKLRSLAIVTTGGFGFFAAFNIYKGNEKFYEEFLIPATRKLPPEFSHKLAIAACKYRIFPRQITADDQRLKVKFLNFDLNNPIGIAAGFDKDGEVPDKLMGIGFGFVEIGSVTPLPQPGNEKPRVFRLPEDRAIINRYGFNSDGHEAVESRIKILRDTNRLNGLLGINLGKNKTSDDPVEDYVKGVRLFAPLADYLVVNVSSPNTPGLRDMQHSNILYDLLSNVVKTRNELPESQRPPILLKLAPDLSKDELQDVAKVLKKKECKVDGLIISNTTIARESLKSESANEAGGLSGAPLTEKSTQMIAQMHKLTGGKIPIIGVGGVFTGQDAFDKILAGATLVQLYTSFIYHGPFVVARVKRELAELVEKNGFKSVNDAVGRGVDKFLPK